MVAATGQHHGKTTVTLGMVQALLSRGWKVAYQKPVGQQTVPVFDETLGKELEIDRDVDIFKFMWPELVGSYSDSSPVAFPPGFTRMVLDGKVHVRDLVSDCKTSFQRLLQASDYVVVEGTGHVGVGSIIDLNNAQVAAELGLDVVLVVPGGIGVSFDVLATNYALLKEHGVALKGVILNKVEPSKMEQNRVYYQKALDRWGVPLMGIVPSDVELPLLSMKSFAQLLKAEWLCGTDQKLRFFHHTRLIVSPNDLSGDGVCHSDGGNSQGLIKAHSLIILHSSRMNDLRTVVSQHLAHRSATGGQDLAGGMIIFGPSRPPAADIAALDAAGVPLFSLCACLHTIRPVCVCVRACARALYDAPYAYLCLRVCGLCVSVYACMRSVRICVCRHSSTLTAQEAAGIPSLSVHACTPSASMHGCMHAWVHACSLGLSSHGR